MKKLIIFSVILILAASSLMSVPRITVYPKILVNNGDTISVEWDNGSGLTYAPDSLIMWGTSPGSYSGTIAQSSDSIATFTPLTEGMTGGVYYCRISDTADGTRSSEFKLYIESDTAPLPQAPANGAGINDLSPILTWDPVAGVPYYTVMMFDTVAEINLGDDSVTINANIIWAATTDQTQMEFPQPDPSGYYDKLDAPPLMQGLTYSWGVVNNYSGSPAMVSQVFAPLHALEVIPAASCSAPNLTGPGDGVTRLAQPITLDWEAATGANSYKVHLLRVEEGDNEQAFGSASIPLWSGETTNTQIDIPENIKLSNQKNFTQTYDWYVVALDAAGKGAKSETRRFYYNTTVTTVNMNTQEIGPLGVTSVPGTILYIESLSGGQYNIYPLASSDTGFLENDVPYGDYKVTAKHEGFNTAEYYFTVSATTVNLDITLTRSAYTLTGFVKDNQGGNPVSGALVTAIYEGTTVTASTLADGAFALYLDTYGDWNVEVTKATYRPATVVVSVADGDYESAAGNIIISKNENVLQGTVTNESAQGIFNAVVTAYETGNTANSYADNTNVSGGYTIYLPDGSWTVTVAKTGFVPPVPAAVSFAADGPKTRDFTMQTQANIISGDIETGTGGSLENVLVRAVPSAGTPVEAYTDSFGHYNISVGTGDFTISAIKTGYTSDGDKYLSFATGGNTSSGNDFVMSENGSVVNGTIVDSGGLTLSAAAVTNGIETAYSNTNGAYSLTMLSGSYTISASLAGYSSPGGRPITVGPGETINNIDFILSPNAAVINGDVKNNSGVAVASATVYVIGPGVTQTAMTDGSGNYSFSVGPAGTTQYSLYASKNGFIDSSVSVVTLSPGQTSDNNALVIIYDTGYVSGTVSNESAFPVGGATVYVLNASGTTKTTTTLADGSYLAGIKTGGFSVYASKSGYTDSGLFGGTVDASNTTLNPVSVPLVITSSAKTIQGTVTSGGSPLNSAQVIVTAPGNTVTVMTNGSGFYSAGISGLSESVNVNVSKAGYITNAQDVNVPGTTTTHDVILLVNYGTLRLDVATSDSADVNAVVSAGGNTTGVSGASPVNNHTMALLPGTYTVTVSQPGYLDAVRAGVVISEGAVTDIGTMTMTVITSTFSVSGNAQDDTSSNLQGVTIEVRKQSDSSLMGSALTDSSGNYTVSGLPNDSYNVYAFKSAYSAGSTNPEPVVISGANAAGIDFTLNMDTAQAYFYVSNGTGPLSGVNVNLDGTGINLGYTGSGTTDASGEVVISGLKPGDYNATLIKSGYITVIQAANGLAGGSVTPFSVTMTPDAAQLGAVAGITALDGGGAVSGVNIEIYDQADPGTVLTTLLSDGTGAFWGLLPAGNYTLKADKDGYSASPPQAYINLVAGNTQTANFTMTEAAGGGVVITAPVTKIYNTNIGGPYVFTAEFKNDSGEIISTTVNWSVEPAASGAMDSAGVFTPTTDYLGEAVIKASALGQTAQYKVSVWQKLNSSMGAVTVKDYEGFELAIPANAADPSNTLGEITLYKYDVNRARAVSGPKKAIGKIHKLTEGFNFVSNVSLTLPVPSVYSARDPEIGTWNKSSLKWETEESTPGEGKVTAFVNHFSEYVVLSALRGLSEEFATFNPNPFSPYHGCQRISYSLNSLEGSSVETTIKVFNMNGDLIRTILDREPRPAGMINNECWDGKNNDGRFVANGRYIIQIEIKDVSGKEQYLHMVAVIK